MPCRRIGILIAPVVFALCACSGGRTALPTQSSASLRDLTLNAAPQITEYEVKPFSNSPGFVALGPDGNVYFTDYIDPDFGASFIGRMTPNGNVTKRFFYGGNFPSLDGIAFGSDKNLWITDSGDGVVAKLNVQSGKITTYTLPGPAAFPAGIAAGPDANLWFVDDGHNSVDSITTNGFLNIYQGGISQNAGLFGIAAGPDANLWFTETFANKIGSITTGGTVHEYSQGIDSNSKPAAIAPGPDGALWFCQKRGIGRITTAGAITEYHGLSSGEICDWIAAGADGAMWFTEHGAAAGAGRITMHGKVTEYRNGITPKSFPYGIAAGAGRTMWFAEEAHRIGKISF